MNLREKKFFETKIKRAINQSSWDKVFLKNTIDKYAIFNKTIRSILQNFV